MESGRHRSLATGELAGEQSAARGARLPSRADAMRVTLRWPDAVPRARAQAMPRDHAKGLLWWQWVEMKRGVETHDRDAVEPAWAER